MDYSHQKPIGHDKALYTFLNCWQNNQLHHAWILQGTKGIGKSTLAHYISRFVLANKYPPIMQEGGLFAEEALESLTLKDMDVAEDNADIKLYHANAHPNFISIEKNIIDGKMQSAITVESIRNLSQQLIKTSREGYRVILIDAIDDFNRNAANAILKVLEEPPQHTLFLLISHNPNKLLPTIISRCRRLNLQPLSPQDMKNAMASYGNENDEVEMPMVLWLAGGAVGKALLIMSEEGQKLWFDLIKLNQDLSRNDISSLSSFCSIYGRKGKGEDEALFHLLIELCLRLLQAKIFVSESCDENLPQNVKNLFLNTQKTSINCWSQALKISKSLLNGDIDRMVGLNRLLLL